VIEIKLPIEISDSRLDVFLKIFQLIKTKQNIVLNWEKVQRISSAGYAVLACLFDLIVEHQATIKNKNLKKYLKEIPSIKNLLQAQDHKTLPDPDIHNYKSNNVMLKCSAGSVDINFMNEVLYSLWSGLSEELFFSSKLIFNELMQNSISHSGAERYCSYAGRWGDEFHIGVLDMGVTIPAKLEQKYLCNNDIDYLELAFKDGITTRRHRTGGLGLGHTIDALRNNKGKLTIISRNAQIKKYFMTRKTSKNLLRYPLNGTWCFTRFKTQGE